MKKRHLRYDWIFNCWWIVGESLYYMDAIVLPGESYKKCWREYGKKA